MRDQIKDRNDMIADADDDAARDAVMIASTQKVEHDEVASGTLRTWANLLGKNDAAVLLEDTLEEEKGADQKLTSIAEGTVDVTAADEDGDEEDLSSAREPAGSRTTSRTIAAARGRMGNRGRR
jgi:ferritin-like metal-binding protein YciE